MMALIEYGKLRHNTVQFPLEVKLYIFQTAVYLLVDFMITKPDISFLERNIRYMEYEEIVLALGRTERNEV
jgi:hypothetical protein